MSHDHDLSVILPRLSDRLHEILDAELCIGNALIEINSLKKKVEIETLLLAPSGA